MKDEDQYHRMKGIEDSITSVALVLCIIAIVLIVMCAKIPSANAESATINDTLIVDQWRWVDVITESPDSAYSMCGIDRGDRLRVIGIDDGEYLLQVENKRIFYGTRCPCKTLFFMNIATADSMRANLEPILSQS